SLGRPRRARASSPARSRVRGQTLFRNRPLLQEVPQTLFLSHNARLSLFSEKSRSYRSSRVSSRPVFFSSFFSSFPSSMAISVSSCLLELAAGTTTGSLLLRRRVCRRAGEGAGADCSSTVGFDTGGSDCCCPRV